MERQVVEKEVIDIIREQLQMGADARISVDAHFFDDLGGDSLDYAETAMEMEDHFDINIPDLEEPKLIKDIVDVVMRHIEAIAS